MYEKFHTVIRPHPPLPFPTLHQNHLEVDPIGIDAIIYAVVWFDPVSVHITWIELLRAETSVDEYFLNAGRPKGGHRDSQSLQEPTALRRKPEPTADLFQCCPMTTRLECS